MNISIIGRQFGITQAIYGYVTDQLKSLVSATPLKITSASVVFGREKNRFTTTLVLNCKYHTLKAEVESFDLYRSFDAAVDKVGHQLYGKRSPKYVKEHTRMNTRGSGYNRNTDAFSKFMFKE